MLTSCSIGPFSTSTSTSIPPTETPTQIASPTPTIVWFPPTATPTQFPTPIITPTVDMRPHIGKKIFSDDFSDKKSWTLHHSESGSVAYGENELTIAIGEVNDYLFSIRDEPVFSDFYLEITAAPSLCRNIDEYGVLYRVSSVDDYYRFTLSCDGQVRLDQVIGGTSYSPQPWIMSGAVPPGAPSKSIIGIAAVGKEMDFFVNGQYQFSIKDPAFHSGGVGVFARSTEKMAVTINFSNLVVYEINP